MKETSYQAFTQDQRSKQQWPSRHSVATQPRVYVVFDCHPRLLANKKLTLFLYVVLDCHPRLVANQAQKKGHTEFTQLKGTKGVLLGDDGTALLMSLIKASCAHNAGELQDD